MLKKTYGVFIVEDIINVAEELARGLEGEGYEVVGICHNKEETLDRLREISPDIILMDIDLSGGAKRSEEGIDLGVFIRQKYDIPIIYMSVYRELLLSDRIRNDSILVKPLNHPEELSILIQHEIGRHDHNNDFLKQRFKNSFLIKAHPQRQIRIRYDDLTYITHKNQLVWFHLKDGSSYSLSTNLTIVLQQLDDKRMLHIHKSYIVNVDMITSIGDQCVYLRDIELPCRKETYNLLRQSFSSIYTKLKYTQLR